MSISAVNSLLVSADNKMMCFLMWSFFPMIKTAGPFRIQMLFVKENALYSIAIAVLMYVLVQFCFRCWGGTFRLQQWEHTCRQQLWSLLRHRLQRPHFSPVTCDRGRLDRLAGYTAWLLHWAQMVTQFCSVAYCLGNCLKLSTQI